MEQQAKAFDLTGLGSPALLESCVGSIFFFTGAIDGGLSEDPILPGDPESLFKSGQFNQVPLIMPEP